MSLFLLWAIGNVVDDPFAGHRHGFNSAMRTNWRRCHFIIFDLFQFRWRCRSPNNFWKQPRVFFVIHFENLTKARHKYSPSNKMQNRSLFRVAARRRRRRLERRHPWMIRHRKVFALFESTTLRIVGKVSRTKSAKSLRPLRLKRRLRSGFAVVPATALAHSLGRYWLSPVPVGFRDSV